MVRHKSSLSVQPVIDLWNSDLDQSNQQESAGSHQGQLSVANVHFQASLGRDSPLHMVHSCCPGQHIYAQDHCTHINVSGGHLGSSKFLLKYTLLEESLAGLFGLVRCLLHCQLHFQAACDLLQQLQALLHSCSCSWYDNICFTSLRYGASDVCSNHCQTQGQFELELGHV